RQGESPSFFRVEHVNHSVLPRTWGQISFLDVTVAEDPAEPARDRFGLEGLCVAGVGVGSKAVVDRSIRLFESYILLRSWPQRLNFVRGSVSRVIRSSPTLRIHESESPDSRQNGVTASGTDHTSDPYPSSDLFPSFSRNRPHYPSTTYENAGTR